MKVWRTCCNRRTQRPWRFNEVSYLRMVSVGGGRGLVYRLTTFIAPLGAYGRTPLFKHPQKWQNSHNERDTFFCQYNNVFFVVTPLPPPSCSSLTQNYTWLVTWVALIHHFSSTWLTLTTPSLVNTLEFCDKLEHGIRLGHHKKTLLYIKAKSKKQTV